MRSSTSATLIVCTWILSLMTTRASAQVSGTVIDSQTKKPIAGAIVKLEAQKYQTTTDAKGAFTLTGFTGAGLYVVAARKGYYNQAKNVSTPAKGVNYALDPVPLGTNKSYKFVDSKTCANCHTAQEKQWNGSPMALAGKNTWVYDIYDGTGTSGGKGGFVYTRDSVHRKSHPNSECASCHQPEPWIQAPGKALDPIGKLSKGSLHGISCEVCHKIANIDIKKPSFPGIWPGVVDFNRPSATATHQIQYGPYADASYVLAGKMRPSYQPQITAEICAACHQDKNDPDGNGNFEEANGIISEPTYLEWVNSAYGNPKSTRYATCVDCHMPSYNSNYVCTVLPIRRDAKTVRSHLIEGTTPRYLENAATLTMKVATVGSTLKVDVDVANDQTGHHLPTGVTVRNMILLVEAWSLKDGKRLAYRGTQKIHSLGGIGDPMKGYYAGMPGKMFAKVNHGAGKVGPVFYTDATGILWDTRIPALATDKTSYSFALPTGVGTHRVRARLIYRRAFRSFVDAKKWTSDGHGRPLADIAAPVYGHLMEQAVWTSQGPGEVQKFGKGCGSLQIGYADSPFSGSKDFAITVQGAKASMPGILVLGASHTAWGPVRLPLPLTALGAPGCSLYVSYDLPLINVMDKQGKGTQALPLRHPAPIGARLFAQWVVMDSSNKLGFSSSDALDFTIQR